MVVKINISHVITILKIVWRYCRLPRSCPLYPKPWCIGSEHKQIENTFVQFVDEDDSDMDDEFWEDDDEEFWSD